MCRQGLILFLAAVLTTNACVTYQPVRAPTLSGKNPYHATSPASISRYIRTVLKTSQENTAPQDAALDQLRQQRPELVALSRRVQQNPADLDSRHALSDAYLKEGLYSQALGLFQEILQQSPSDIHAALGLARIWDSWGDYSLARQYAEQVVIQDGGCAAGYELLGRICLHQKDTDSALRAFQAALQLDSQTPSILANIGYVHVLRLEWDKARDYLERALQMDGTIQEAHNHLGIVLAHLGKRDAAIREFMAANPPAASFNNLGAIYLAENHLQEARIEFLHALSLQPAYAKAEANLQSVEALLPPPALVMLKPFPNDVQTPVPRQLNTVDFAELQPVKPAPLHDYVRSMFVLPPIAASAVQVYVAEPGPASNRTYAIQVHAYRMEAGARTACDKLAKASSSVEISRVDLPRTGIWYRVRLQGYPSRKAAMNAARGLLSRGLIRDFWVVPGGSVD